MRGIIKRTYLYIRKYCLTCFSIFWAHKRNNSIGANDEIKKILFIRIDRIGDLVLSTPVLRNLKNAFPGCKLTVLASSSNHSILFNNPYVDKVIVYNQNQSFFKKFITVIKLRAFEFDYAIDPYPDYELTTALIALVSGARGRLGYGSYGRELFFNINAPAPATDRHFIDLTLDILKPIGVIIKDKVPEIFLSEAEKEWSRYWIQNNQIGTKPIVGIHPGAYYESQRWPAKNFSVLVDKLMKCSQLDFILFGGPQDSNLVDRIRSKIHARVPTFIAKELRQFIGLLSTCSILLCNNSGPLHTAVAMKIPTLSFMGPTEKDRWMPVGCNHKVLRIDDLSCIGCNEGYCPKETHDCMRLITPSMVIDSLNIQVRSMRNLC
jgi:lipopolysaccharide heptosyltransferase II